MSFDRSSTYDSLVDHYVEAIIVFPMDYFVLDPFSGSSCGNMPHWSIFILIIPSQSQLGISSHHLFTVMAFRAISLSTFQAFRATIFLQLGVQSRSLGIQSRLISLVRH